jgi:hypothetical protein
MARTGNPCRGREPPDQWPVEGRWLGNICLTEVVSARSIINLMMRYEGKVATILIAWGPDDSGRGGRFGLWIATPATGFNLLVND